MFVPEILAPSQILMSVYRRIVRVTTIDTLSLPIDLVRALTASSMEESDIIKTVFLHRILYA